MSLLIKTFGGCAGLCSVFEAQVFRITHIIPVRSGRNKWSENIILNSGVQRKPLLTNNWMIPSEIAKLPRTWNIWLVWEMASVQGKLNRSFFSKWRGYLFTTFDHRYFHCVILQPNVKYLSTKGHFYRLQRSCGQGNIFTGVSVHGGGRVSASVHAGMPYPPPDGEPPPPDGEPPDGEPTPFPPRWRTPPPPGSRLQHTVYERPVRILLECILVKHTFKFILLFGLDSL